MTLQQLEYVTALDDTRHFVRAAQQCYVTQPTLTMQVKKLEDEIGFQLFDRSKHPLEPTPAGIPYILKARQILREVRQLECLVKDERQSLDGLHRIGVIPTLAPYLIPRFLGKFSEDHPEVELQIDEIQTASIIEGLKQDKLDVGILVTPVEDEQIREVHLFMEPFAVYTSPANPLYQKEVVNPQDITQDKLWLLNEGHCFREQVLNICNQQKPEHERVHYETGSIETLKNLVKHQMGYTLVPELSVLEETDNPMVKPFADPKPVREVSLVVHRSYAREMLIEKLREYILASIPKQFTTFDDYIKVRWK